MIFAFLPGQTPGNLVTTEHKVPWCVAAGAVLRRRYAEYAYLKSLFLHKK
jgi:hypothetical protein